MTQSLRNFLDPTIWSERGNRSAEARLLHRPRLRRSYAAAESCISKCTRPWVVIGVSHGAHCCQLGCAIPAYRVSCAARHHGTNSQSLHASLPASGSRTGSCAQTGAHHTSERPPCPMWHGARRPDHAKPSAQPAWFRPTRMRLAPATGGDGLESDAN